MGVFDDYELTDEQKKKGRRVLRRFASIDYFGNITSLMIRTVANNIDEDLLLEAERMFEWAKEKRKKSSILRFDNWMKNVKVFRVERESRHLSDQLSRDLKKVEDFRKTHVPRKSRDKLEKIKQVHNRKT